MFALNFHLPIAGNWIVRFDSRIIAFAMDKIFFCTVNPNIAREARGLWKNKELE